MHAARFVRRGVMGAAAVTGAAVVATRDTPLGRALRRAGHGAAAQVRYWRSAWPGVRYRLRGGHPDLDVPDDVLADRVRSSLGRLGRRLDIPRVHVMVHDRVVTLHGDVPTSHGAHTLERAAHRVAGVRGVESYLHIGFLRGDTRPSEGSQPGPARRSLLEAARAAGVPEGEEARAARVVLASFMERLPEAERQHVLLHLPVDARSLAEPARRHGMSDLRATEDLEKALVVAGAVEPGVAGDVVRSVLRALHALVPEEVADVAAVLPAELRATWEAAGESPTAAGAPDTP